jgi:hypothetical protein
VERVGVSERSIEALELAPVLEHDVGVEELAELGLAEQLAELRVIDRQRLRAPLGGRGVLVVDEAPDEGEEERRGHRRRGRDVDARDPYLS